MTERMMIIGGAGFIGSHLVDAALGEGFKVAVYDNFSTGRHQFLKAQAVQITQGDILDGPCLIKVMRQFSPAVVVHLAAIHHIPTCEKEPDKAYRANVEGLQNVLTSLKAVPVRRLVFASSGAVYDNCAGSLSERASLRPQGVYALTKYFGERMLEDFVFRHQMQVVIARLFNTVGPRETNAHLVPDILKQLLQGEDRIRLGNISTKRDYIHVQDVAAALLTLSRAQIKDGIDYFNIGSGREYSVTELVEALAKIIDAPVSVFSDPLLRRPQDRPTQLADITKITAMTSWRPQGL